MATQSCKCGFRGDRARVCTCTPREVDAYRARISGPLLDRIDLHVEVPALDYAEISAAPAGEGTAEVRARVQRARAAQRKRLEGAALHCNAQMGAREVREHCSHDEGCARLLEGAMRALGLSARGYARVLKVARTIADLEGARDRDRAHRRGDPVPRTGTNDRVMERRWGGGADGQREWVTDMIALPELVPGASRTPRRPFRRRCGRSTPSTATLCSFWGRRAIG